MALSRSSGKKASHVKKLKSALKSKNKVSNGVHGSKRKKVDKPVAQKSQIRKKVKFDLKNNQEISAEDHKNEENESEESLDQDLGDESESSIDETEPPADKNKKSKLNFTEKSEYKMHNNKTGTVDQLSHDCSRCKVIWEELRKKNLDNNLRKQLMEQLMNIVKGKIPKIIMKPDMCRVFECALKYGSKEQREALVMELCDKFVLLSKNIYTKFAMKKIIKYCGTDIRKRIIESFNGQIPKLIRHSNASSVVNELYSYSNSKQRKYMYMELYGSEYVHFKNEHLAPISEIMTTNKTKRDIILANMKDNIVNTISKDSIDIASLEILSRLILEYLTYAEKANCDEIIDIIKEKLPAIIYTSHGSQVAMRCILLASTKDKKFILKSLKTCMKKIACDRYGHLVLMTALDCVDDTVFMDKVVVQELLNSNPGEMKPSDLMMNNYGSLLVVYLLVGRRFPLRKSLVVSLQKNYDLYGKGSKKFPELRRDELLEASGPIILEALCKECPTIIRSSNASNIITAAVSCIENANALLEEIVKEISKPLDGFKAKRAETTNKDKSHLDNKKLVSTAKLSKEIQAESLLKSGIDLEEHVFYNKSSAMTIRGIIFGKKLSECMSYSENDAKIATKNSSTFIDMIFPHILNYAPDLIERCIQEPSSTHHISMLILTFLEYCNPEMKTKITNRVLKKLKLREKKLDLYVRENLLSQKKADIKEKIGLKAVKTINARS